MTKRELIDQILTENHTAEPAFLAQFSDEQLRDYLLHLKQAKQPRPPGTPSRYDRYFHNCPAVTTAAAPSRWKTEGGSLQPVPKAAPELSAASDSPPVATQGILPSYVDGDAVLPQETDALEAMQLTPQERSGLHAPIDDPADPDEPTGRNSSVSSFANKDDDQEGWLL
ncbi:MAG: hypothetical protein ABSH10_04095 [Phycisphaerae bacterium]|jgi:hypothetical protein